MNFPLNVLAAIQEMLSYPFMRNALLAGTIVAIVAGVVGYFMVLRDESFAGHTLANVGFAGAAGAAMVGIPAVAGLIGFGVAAALGIGALTERSLRGRSHSNVAIGTILALALGLGILFERLASTKVADIYAILFGSAISVSSNDVRTILITALITLATLAVIARPLLFASIDPEVAEARGVPVRWLTWIFLALLALAVAMAVQVVGVLLIFSLLVSPGAAAQEITTRPLFGIILSVALALLVTWSGIIVAYFTPYPVGFYITSFAFAAYLLARLIRFAMRRRAEPRHAAPLPVGGVQ